MNLRQKENIHEVFEKCTDNMSAPAGKNIYKEAKLAMLVRIKSLFLTGEIL